MRLSELDTAFVIEDLKLPGFDFHTLKGNKKGIWSIKFNGNCRLTLAYENKILIIENLDFQSRIRFDYVLIMV